MFPLWALLTLFTVRFLCPGASLSSTHRQRHLNDKIPRTPPQRFFATIKPRHPPSSVQGNKTAPPHLVDNYLREVVLLVPATAVLAPGRVAAVVDLLPGLVLAAADELALRAEAVVPRGGLAHAALDDERLDQEENRDGHQGHEEEHALGWLQCKTARWGGRWGGGVRERDFKDEAQRQGLHETTTVPVWCENMI